MAWCSFDQGSSVFNTTGLLLMTETMPQRPPPAQRGPTDAKSAQSRLEKGGPSDHFDCVIMAELRVRGDLPNVEPARRLGLSPAATLRRVQQLRSDGRIEGIRAVIDHEKVGLRVEAFVPVTSLNIPKPVTPSSHGLWTACRMCCAPTPSPEPTMSCSTIAAIDTRELQDVFRTLPASAPDA
jgi:Lrp/AsnC family transcriptional regulator, leucine-responsive regulatory protein